MTRHRMAKRAHLLLPSIAFKQSTCAPQNCKEGELPDPKYAGTVTVPRLEPRLMGLGDAISCRVA
jgi:hypothetical protein